jgi:hypothetical protein
MKIARLEGLAVIAVLTMSLVVASMAPAEPEFKPATATLTGTSGPSVLEANDGIEKLSCEKTTLTGRLTSATLAGGLVVHFLGCTSTGEGGSNCAVNSLGGSVGLIVTKTLHGVLGLILPKAGTGVGLLLLPATGKAFTTLAANACTEETTISGNIAGEVEPIGKSQLTGKVTFAATGVKQAIKGFDPSTGGTTTAKLTLFAAEASESLTESLTYSTATEVS